MKEIVIDVQKVSKKYKKSETLALSEITFQVERGAIAAFLGPNGAGKSTMIKIILGIIRATEGCSCLLGRDSAKLDSSIYRQIGVFMGGKNQSITTTSGDGFFKIYFCYLSYSTDYISK